MDAREEVWLRACVAALEKPGYAAQDAVAKADAVLRAFDRRFGPPEPSETPADAGGAR